MWLPLMLFGVICILGGAWLIQQDIRRRGAPELITWGVLIAGAALLALVLQAIRPVSGPDEWLLVAAVEVASVAIAVLACWMLACVAYLFTGRTMTRTTALVVAGGVALLGVVALLHWAFYSRQVPLTLVLFAVLPPLLVPACTLITHAWWRPLQQRLYAARAAKHEPSAVIVLGAGLRPDGTPTSLLRRRIDRGLIELERSTDAPLVLCGGQGPDEPHPEARAMAVYAEQQGADPERFLLETKSTSTEENLRWARTLLAGQEAVERAAVVTSEYHVPRAGDAMRKAGIDGWALPSFSEPRYRTIAVLREVAALLWSRKLVSGLLFAATLIPAAYSLLGLIGYAQQ